MSRPADSVVGDKAPPLPRSLDRVRSYPASAGYVFKAPLESLPLDEGMTANEHVDSLAHFEDCQQEDEKPQDHPIVVESLRGCIVVLGCVLIALPCMGWGMVQGAFQDYYASTYYPDTPESVISFIGGIIAALCTGLAPFGGRLGDHYGYKPVMACGLFFCSFSLLVSAFCTQIWQTFIAQGLLFGVGQCMVVPLILSLPSQWFGPHKALATGLVGGAAGVGGAVSSIISRIMLSRLPTPSFRNTMLIFFGMDLVVWSCGWYLIEERVKRKGSFRRDIRKLWDRVRGTRRKRLSFATEEMPGRLQESSPASVKMQPAPEAQVGFLQGLERSSVFWCLIISVFISTFSYLPAFQFISTYTREHVQSDSALLYAVPLAVMNAFMALGRLCGGQVADHLGATQTLFLYLQIAGLLQIIAWHFAKSFAGICVFAAFYGFFGSITLSLVPVVAGQLFGRTDRLASVVGLVMQSTAAGQLIGGYIAGKILSATGGSWLAFQLFTGFMQIVGGAFMLWPWYRGLGFPWPRTKDRA